MGSGWLGKWVPGTSLSGLGCEAAQLLIGPLRLQVACSPDNLLAFPILNVTPCNAVRLHRLVAGIIRDVTHLPYVSQVLVCAAAATAAKRYAVCILFPASQDEKILTYAKSQWRSLGPLPVVVWRSLAIPRRVYVAHYYCDYGTVWTATSRQ